MISFNSVSKIYNRDIVALRDVNFEIDDGEFMFLVGHSGAGKSTLIRLLIRQEIPTEGNILFGEIDVTQITRKMLPDYRQNIGVVFQDYKLIKSKTIKENIEFALEITGNSDSEIEDTSDSLLEIVKLNQRGHLFPDQLSGGEKQRAGIARALANDPKLLIADEPTGNLDPATSEEIMEILEKINSWGTTIMIATHDKETVNRLQKRVVRLEKGTVVSDLQKASYNSYASKTHVVPDTVETAVDGQNDSKPKNTNSNPKKGNSNSKKAQKNSKNKASEKKSFAPEKGEGKPESDSHVQEPDPLDTISVTKLSLPGKLEKTLIKNELDTIGKILDLSQSDLDNIEGIGENKRKLIIHEVERLLSREK